MEQSFYIIIGVSCVITALVLVLVSIPLVRGRVAMNKTYGIRLAKAFESQANWYMLNRFGGKQLILSSVGVAVAGVLFCVVRPVPTVWSFWVLILAPAWLLGFALWRIRSFAGRLP